MQHYSAGSRGWSAPRALRTGAFLLLAAAWTGSSAGCLLVIGEQPERDAAGDSDADLDAGASGEPDRGQDEPDADVTPVPDAGGSDTGQHHDSGSDAAKLDAGGHADADAASDESDATLDGSSQPSQDAATQDSAATLDTGMEDTGTGCTTTTTWYPDEDGDGFGRAAGAVQACAKPAGKWSQSDADCNDDLKSAYPGQTALFDAPYPLGNGQDSFDYNCSGVEEGDPGQASLADGCGALLDLGLLCNQISGYMPRGDRSGGARNSMCGSGIIAHCQVMVLSCVPGSPEQSSTLYRCR